MDPLVATRDHLALIEQYPYSHGFQAGHHLNGIVVAEPPVNRPPQLTSHASDAVQGGLEGSKGLGAIVAGQNTEVVTHLTDEFAQSLHRDLVHFDVHIADVQDGEAIEKRRQILEGDVVVLDDDALCIATRAPVETAQLQGVSNDRPGGIPVLQAKTGEALAENLGFVAGLDSQSLSRMQSSEALLQFC